MRPIQSGQRLAGDFQTGLVMAGALSPAGRSILLFGVYAMVQTGLSEREAVRRIADAKVFPHYERQSSQRPSGHATRIARQRALWRKYQRLRAQSRGPDPIGRQLAIGVTDFEMFLTGLGLPAPSAAPSGDKPRARKSAVCKSPSAQRTTLRHEKILH